MVVASAMRTRRQQEMVVKSGGNIVSPTDETGRSRRNGDCTVTVEYLETKHAAETQEEDLQLVEEESEEESEDEEDNELVGENHQVYVLDGVEYTDYQEFVAAKRKRNQKVLENLGFNDDSTKFMSRKKPKTALQRGIKSNKSADALTSTSTRSRRSSRLSGGKTKLVALDYYVNNWNNDSKTIVQEDGAVEVEGDEEGNDRVTRGKQGFFNDRVNDGSELSIQGAVRLNDPKWIRDNSVDLAKTFLDDLATSSGGSNPTSRRNILRKSMETSRIRRNTDTKCPTSAVYGTDDWDATVITQVESLSIDKDEWVAKVTPDRIYSVVAHPSESKLVCCAGDKQGYIGLWDVDGATSENNNGVNLFRVHSRPICCLQWLNSNAMISASYDGTVRRLDVETGTFEEIFATYDDSDTTFAGDLGYDLDQGSRYWTQYVTQDPRYHGSSNPCLFVSTSVGDIFHLDLRVAHKERITFHESVSDRKVNTVRYDSMFHDD